MNVATIYLCGWAVGLLALRHAALRTWKDPEFGPWMVPFRRAFNSPHGLVALGIVTFMFWWYLVAAIPVSIVGDWRYRPDDEDPS